MFKKMMLVAIMAVCAIFTCTLSAQMSPADIVKATEKFSNIKEFQGIFKYYDNGAVIFENGQMLRIDDMKATADFMSAVDDMRKNPSINGYIAMMKAMCSSETLAKSMGGSEESYKQMKQMLTALQSASKEQLAQMEKQLLANKDQILKELPDVNEFFAMQKMKYKTLKVISEKIDRNVVATVITEYTEHKFDKNSKKFVAGAKIETKTNFRKINGTWKIVSQIKER